MGTLESCCDESGSQTFEYEALSKQEFVDPTEINKAWQHCVISRNLVSLPGEIVEDDKALESPVTLDGQNALLYYADQGWFDGVKFLVEKLKCDINFSHEKTGDTALHLAARSGYTKIIIFLLGNGADPTIENEFGEIAEQVCLLKRDRKHFDSTAIEQRRIEARSQTRLSGLKKLIMSDDSEPESIVNAASLSPAPLDLGMAMESYRLVSAETVIRRSIEDRVFREIRDPKNEAYFRFKSVQTEIARQLAIELDVMATLFRRTSFEMKFQWWLKATDYDMSVYEEAVDAELKGESEETITGLADAASRIGRDGRRRKKTKHNLFLGSPSTYAVRGPGQTNPTMKAHSKYLPSITGGHELIKLLIAVISRMKSQHLRSSAFQINMDDIKALMPHVKSKFTPTKEESIARITLLETYLSEQNPILMGFGFGDYTDESDAETELDAAVLLGYSEREIRHRSHVRRKRSRKKKRKMKEEMLVSHTDGKNGDDSKMMDEEEDLDTEIDEEKRRMFGDGSTRRLTYYEILHGPQIIELEDLSHKFELTFDDFLNKFGEALFYIHDELHIKWVKFNKAERKKARKEQQILEEKERERMEEFRRKRSMTMDTLFSGSGSSSGESEDEFHRRGSSIRELVSHMRSPSRSRSETESGSEKKKKKGWFSRMKSAG